MCVNGVFMLIEKILFVLVWMFEVYYDVFVGLFVYWWYGLKWFLILNICWVFYLW